MPLEDAQFISELNPVWPLGTDGVNTSDDHHRNTKRAVQQSFPNIDKAVTSSSDDLNLLSGSANTGPLVPRAAVLPYYGTNAPNGYLMCNGSAIPAQYPELIAIVGANTPDLRGQFLRGWSTTTAQDPSGPRNPGSTQSEEFKSHTHVGPLNRNGNPPATGFLGSLNIGGDGNATTLAAGGAETRPKNIAIGFIIKW